MSENAKALSGIYGFVPLSDEPTPKKKQESNLEDCLDCEFLGLDELGLNSIAKSQTHEFTRMMTSSAKKSVNTSGGKQYENHG